MDILPTPRICNFIDSLISWVRSFTESYLSDIDNIVTFENTNPINQNKRLKWKNAEQVDQINEWYVRTVQCCQCQINMIQ